MAYDEKNSRAKTPRVNEQIDENLKRVYDDALKEALPDRFLSLIEQLRAKEGGSDDGK